MNQNNAQATLDYYKLTESFRPFPPAILKIIIEDRQNDHNERINNYRNLVVLKSGDVVIA